ncbi:conserved Plasmodium protein, unknown function [Plasmodium ovale]|uniref:Uncharacterized protein n=2 Tax=Plasmodium ovale TaxID=36330 RepID=A0A1A8VW82_PLAOA|nr:conserved Plasmodium protein, unknown function [Plasmodium ovale curtisi]SCP04551.1 conserved Plasmodium protein, unknown function [Plasmodium ovale]
MDTKYTKHLVKKAGNASNNEEKVNENANDNHTANIKKGTGTYSSRENMQNGERRKGNAYNLYNTKNDKCKGNNIPSEEGGGNYEKGVYRPKNSTGRLGKTNRDNTNHETNGVKINQELTKKEDDKNVNLIINIKRSLGNEMKEELISHKKQKIESFGKNDCELSVYNELDNIIFHNNQNGIKSYMNRIKKNFFSYWKECDYQLKKLKKCYVENEKLIKEIVFENNQAIIGNTDYINTKIEEKMNDTTKIEKKRKMLNCLMNIKLIYRVIEMYLFTMRQFSLILKENNNFISLILDEENIEKNNYERIIGNLLRYEAKNYEDIKKHNLKKKMLCMDDFLKSRNEKNIKTCAKDEISHLYILKCLEEEINERINAKEELAFLITKKKQYINNLVKQEQKKAISFNKLSLFTCSIKNIIDKYSSLNIYESKYLSTLYDKMMCVQNDMNINNVSILNNKKPFNLLFNFKEQNKSYDVFTYMKYNIITKLRKEIKNSSSQMIDDHAHMEYLTIKFITKENFDISILPDLTYLKHLNVQINVFHLHKNDCLVAKISPIDFIGLKNGHKLLSDIYHDQDHYVLFSNNLNDFHNFTYGFPFFWLNAMAEKQYEHNMEDKKIEGDQMGKKGDQNNSEINRGSDGNGGNGSPSGKLQGKKPDRDMLSEIYNWHLGRTLDVSVFFSKIFTRILYRIWDIWQIRHYKHYPNVFPPFSHDKHMEALKKIHSVSLQQITHFDIITEEAYLKEEKENIHECDKDNIYACCIIELYDSHFVKSYIIVPMNGKEPYFSVFLTKKRNVRRLKKLQDYLNTTVVNKHSKVEDTQRQIILTLQLAKLREGAYKYHKSFNRNSTPTFDEDIN